MALGWFAYSLISVVLFGISMVFYKLPSFKNYSPFISTFYTNTLSTILALSVFYLFSNTNSIKLSKFGLVWGVAFAVTMVLQKILLKKIETNALFPVTTSVSNVLTILVGFFILGERLTILQIAGVAVVLSAIYLFTRKKEDFSLTPDVILFALGVVLASTVGKYIQKLGAINDSVYDVLISQHLSAALMSLLGAFIFEKSIHRELVSSKKYILGAFLIGVPGFLGGWAVIKALSMAPISVIYSIHPAYVLVTAIAGALIFKENLTTRKILLILLTILGVVLIKIG